MLKRLGATTLATACLAALVACPPSGPGARAPKPDDDTALRIRIAHAEAKRAGGIAELTELGTSSDPARRALALRGLGRIGGPKAIAVLLGALADREPAVVGAAASAIGLLASLDEADAGAAFTQPLLDALPRALGNEVAVIEAIGRAAGVEAQARLVDGLAGPPDITVACAIALGRYGRRKLAITDPAREGLVTALRNHETRVRAAAIWALAREHEPDKLDESTRTSIASAIAALVTDRDAETRALAINAIGRRKVLGFVDKAPLLVALGDADWRVGVEAARVLLGADSDEATRATAISALESQIKQLAETGEPAAQAHVIVEGLRTYASVPLASRGDAAKPTIRALHAIRHTAGLTNMLSALTRSWIDCLVLTTLPNLGEHSDSITVLSACGPAVPDHLRLPLLGDIVIGKRGTAEVRREIVRTLLAHVDPRVRASGMQATAAVWPDATEQERRAWLAVVIAALGTKDPITAGNAVEAAGSLYDVVPKDSPQREELDAAIVARAGGELDPELSGALFELIGKRALASGVTACRAGLTGAPVRARAAATCLEQLGTSTPVPAIGEAQPPPVDVAQVIGKRVRWRLATTRGSITIALRPDIAPWAVATIVTLTRKGTYDGLEFHRVVPNFVVQGGDPTQSGWGGPGFSLPAEPSQGPALPDRAAARSAAESRSSGAGYVVGGVGMADAGRDSAGSQWFIMHSAAPHLDGRYTWIGSVESGQKAADALLIGDKVTRATVEILP